MCNSIHGEGSYRRWSFSTGAKTRRVEYSFDSRGLDNWQDYITPYQSQGSSELYTGTPYGGWSYGDGEIESGGDSSEYTGGDLTRLDNGFAVVRFHSTVYTEPEVTTDNSFSISHKNAVIPYFIIRRSAGSVGISLSCSANRWEFDDKSTFSQTVIQNRTRYEFLYDVDTGTDEGFEVILDHDSYYWDLPKEYGPQRNVTSQDTVVAGTLNGVMDAEVDIYWYELTLGLDWTQSLFNRLDLFALVGPTMHLLDWEMEHSTTWTVAGADSPATTTRASDDGTKTLVGGVAELGINLYLDSDRRYFIEASGEYLYLEDVTLNAGAASVNIDPESWGGKLGIGIRL